MNAIYLKRDTYVVCTFQMNTEPRKFIEDRPNANVSKGERMLLTTKDRNLDSSFICKKPMNQAGSFLAFGAGILLVVTTGPIGWAACGFLLFGLYFLNKSCTHDCSNPLKAGSWRNEKNGVYFNGGVALTEYSFLVCGSGGLLKPFFNEKYAKKAIGDIQFYNYTELGVNVLGSFLM